MGMFEVLKKIIVYLAPLINTKWKMDQIGTIIEKSLNKANQQAVRLWGFELLLNFIESLQNSMSDLHLQMFGSAINLKPFVPPGSTVLLRGKAEQSKPEPLEGGNVMWCH